MEIDFVTHCHVVIFIVSTSLLSIGLSIFLLLSSVIYRDYSWSRSIVSLKSENMGLQKNIDSYKLRLLVDELSHFKLFLNAIIYSLVHRSIQFNIILSLFSLLLLLFF
jgi:hypothetical protein